MSRAARPKTPEAAVLKACLQLLALRGVPAWRNNSGAARIGGRFVRFGHVGSSDIFGVLPGSGRLICVEAKRPDGGRTTEAQRAFLDTVDRAGGVAVVVDDVAQLAKVLDELGV